MSKHSQHKDKGSQKVNISMIFIVHETKYGRFKMSYQEPEKLKKSC